MKHIIRVFTAIFKSIWLWPIAISTALTWPSDAWSQASSGTSQRRQGGSCPDGQYAGRPSPDRTRYIKNDYVWAVTREFAQRFCMPEEFVVDDLKGAEAIAYWHGKPTGQEVCEIKDGQEVCALSRYGHWLEIYVKTGAIPKYDPEVGFYVRNYVTSGSVIGSPSRERIVEQAKKESDARKRGQILEPPGQRRPFYGIGPMADGKRLQFRYLARITPTQVDERSAALSEHYYRQNWYEGIDLIALEGWSWGAITGKEKLTPSPKFGYAIGVTGEIHDAGKLSYPDGFLHVIELPQRIVQVVNAADRRGGEGFDEAVRNLGASIKQPVR